MSSTLPLWTQWIWWIVALIVAAAGGYAVFFRTIPMLTEMRDIARRQEKKWDDFSQRYSPLRPKPRSQAPPAPAPLLQTSEPPPQEQEQLPA